MAKRGARSLSPQRERSREAPSARGITPQPPSPGGPDDHELQRLLSAPAGEPGHDAHEAQLLEQFFSWPPPESVEPSDEPNFEPARLSPESKRAMWASLAMLVVSSTAIGSYAAYYRFVVPRPQELSGVGVGDGLMLPTPPPPASPKPKTELAPQAETAPSEQASAPALVQPQPSSAGAHNPSAESAREQGEEPVGAARTQPPGQVAAGAGSDLDDPRSEPAPDSFDGVLARARVLAAEHEDRAALQLWEQALRLRAFEPEALAGKAASLLRLGELEASKAAAEQAVALAPRNAQGFATLAAALALLGEGEAARAVGQRCREQVAPGDRAACDATWRERSSPQPGDERGELPASTPDAK